MAALNANSGQKISNIMDNKTYLNILLGNITLSHRLNLGGVRTWVRTPWAPGYAPGALPPRGSLLQSD